MSYDKISASDGCKYRAAQLKPPFTSLQLPDDELANEQLQRTDGERHAS